jgi:hypothetical protein
MILLLETPIVEFLRGRHLNHFQIRGDVRFVEFQKLILFRMKKKTLLEEIFLKKGSLNK